MLLISPAAGLMAWLSMPLFTVTGRKNVTTAIHLVDTRQTLGTEESHRGNVVKVKWK